MGLLCEGLELRPRSVMLRRGVGVPAVHFPQGSQAPREPRGSLWFFRHPRCRPWRQLGSSSSDRHPRPDSVLGATTSASLRAAPPAGGPGDCGDASPELLPPFHNERSAPSTLRDPARPLSMTSAAPGAAASRQSCCKGSNPWTSWQGCTSCIVHLHNNTAYLERLE